MAGVVSQNPSVVDTKCTRNSRGPCSTVNNKRTDGTYYVPQFRNFICPINYLASELVIIRLLQSTVGPGLIIEKFWITGVGTGFIFEFSFTKTLIHPQLTLTIPTGSKEVVTLRIHSSSPHGQDLSTDNLLTEKLSNNLGSECTIVPYFYSVCSHNSLSSKLRK